MSGGQPPCRFPVVHFWPSSRSAACWVDRSRFPPHPRDRFRGQPPIGREPSRNRFRPGSHAGARNRRRLAWKRRARARAGFGLSRAGEGVLGLGLWRLGNCPRGRIPRREPRDCRCAAEGRSTADDFLSGHARLAHRRAGDDCRVARDSADQGTTRHSIARSREVRRSSGGGEYLETLGDAEPRYTNESLPDEDRKAILGDYSFGSGVTDCLNVTVNARGNPSFSEPGPQSATCFTSARACFTRQAPRQCASASLRVPTPRL